VSQLPHRHASAADCVEPEGGKTQSTQSPRSGSWLAKFLTIWIGQQLSFAGSMVGRFALIWWLTTTTGSAVVLASSTLIAFAPSILLGPFVGPLIDRWNRRWVLLVSDGFTAMLSLWLAYLFWSGSMEIWHVYVVVLGRAIGSSFHGTTLRASTTLLVPRDQLGRVNGLNQMISALLSIAGPALGALLLSILPLHGIMMVDVATAACAILPLCILRIPQPGAEHIHAIRRKGYFSNLAEGVHFIRRWPGLIALIVLTLVLKIALTPALSLVPLLVHEQLKKGAGGLGLFQSLVGIGAAAGGLLLSVWGGGRRRTAVLLIGLIGVGAGVLVVGTAPASMFLIALCGAFVLGTSMSLVSASSSAVMQTSVPAQLQGRVFTLVSSAVSLTTPIGLGLAGPVSEWLGVRAWFQAGGALCMAVGALGFFIPALLRIESGVPETDPPSSGKTEERSQPRLPDQNRARS